MKKESANEAKATIKQKKREEDKKKVVEEPKTEAKKESMKEKVEKIKAEVKGEKPKKEKKEQKVLEERVMILGLRRIMDSRRTKRTSRAIKLIREKVKRIAKKPVKINTEVNRKMWERGIQKPPKKIKLKIKIMEDFAEVFLA